MTLSLVQGDSRSPLPAVIDWPTVQLAQFRHDETYHREISRLTVQERLTHMALHFAKYAGRLLAPHDENTFKQTAVDTMVIAVSCANILNLAIGQQSLLKVSLPGGRDDFSRELAISAGKMAAACEKLDHLEDYPFRSAVSAETVRLINLTLSIFAVEGWEPTQEMATRLDTVKKKSIFYGQA